MATVELGEPRTSTRLIDRSVWLTYTAERDGRLTFDDEGSLPTNNDLVVYEGGTSLDRLGIATSGARSRSGVPVAVTIDARAGTTYLVVLGSDMSGARGGQFVSTGGCRPRSSQPSGTGTN